MSGLETGITCLGTFWHCCLGTLLHSCLGTCQVHLENRSSLSLSRDSPSDTVVWEHFCTPDEEHYCTLGEECSGRLAQELSWEPARTAAWARSYTAVLGYWKHIVRSEKIFIRTHFWQACLGTLEHCWRGTFWHCWRGTLLHCCLGTFLPSTHVIKDTPNHYSRDHKSK